MTSHAFLSDDWIEEARRIKGAHAANPVAQVDLVVNATITGVPFGSGTIEAHSDHGPVIGWEIGHAPSADFAITLDYALARELVLDRTFGVLAQAADSGAFEVDGDVDRFRAWWTTRIGNPDVVALDDELRELTA